MIGCLEKGTTSLNTSRKNGSKNCVWVPWGRENSSAESGVALRPKSSAEIGLEYDAKSRLNCFAVRALNDAIKAIVVRKVAEGSGLGMP